MNLETNICFIPARGGSKRIPRKNVALLAGQPLISYTILAAIESECFSVVVVSSEDEEILRIAQQFGASIHKRDVDLASDTVTKDELIANYLTKNNVSKGTITCLLPTCPFRTAPHIQEALHLAKQDELKNPVISIRRYEFPTDFALTKTLKGSLMQPDNIAAYSNTISQSKKVKYHPNGAIYIREVSQFLAEQSFFSSSFIGYEMKEVDSWDIDEPWQLEVAELMMAKRNK